MNCSNDLDCDAVMDVLTAWLNAHALNREGKRALRLTEEFQTQTLEALPECDASNFRTSRF